jgi:wyosine [tRNA(Phe)-imidazoG37] synthetase (radical SAM superfamily)
MGQTDYRYVFGPVPSRRLGRSLGVDLVPFKVCTYDCVYCQVGCTTNKTVARQEFVPMEEVLAEIEHRLAEGASPDFVTMSGSGEPTLYSRLGELIAGVKERCDVPVAVITNGSLLWMPEVRRDLRRADLVVPSLDAGDPEAFETANRPHADIRFEQMVDGLVAFSDEFDGKLWLEVFMLEGVTDTDAAVERLAEQVRRIDPDRVQINTVVRPPAESFARPASRRAMERFAALFGEKAAVIAEYRRAGAVPEVSATHQEILSMLRRRPCSMEDVANGLSIHRNEALKYLDILKERGVVVIEDRGGVAFYVAKSEQIPQE